MASIAIGMLNFGNHRKLFDIISDHIKKTWNDWALQELILISISSQILLVLLGNLRKHNPRTRIRIILWCCYLLPNVVASAALGIITQLDECTTSRPISQYQKLNASELKFFWTPFLLIHLGYPDTITAYSLEDNEFWLRHLAKLVVPYLVAFYILLLSLPGCSNLPLLSLLVYVVGFIKSYARIQALRLANTEHIRDSILGSPDPGPSYSEFLEAFHLMQSQGLAVEVEEEPEVTVPPIDHAYPEGRGKVICEAYDLFQTFKGLFVDLVVTFEDQYNSRSYFSNLRFGEAFSIVEMELGFAYGMFYTKASAVYTFVGLVIHVTGVFLILTVALGFSFVCNTDDYRGIDVALTYLLLATAAIMDIFVVITMLQSDWTDHWLGQHGYTRNILMFPFLKHPTKPRWSKSIAQLNLLGVALQEKPTRFLQAQKFFGVDKYRVKHRYKTYNHVSDNLKDLIYTQFHMPMNSTSGLKALCNDKGSFSLQKNHCHNLLWSIMTVEFDQSILIWHIAFDLCYYSELKDDDDDHDQVVNVHRTSSKHISDYLVYLLISYPEMLSTGFGMVRWRDTCAEAMHFFEEKGQIFEKVEACRKLLEVDCRVLPRPVSRTGSKSVLFDGCRLALTLKEMEREQMWKVMSEVLIEILAYAATRCRGLDHAQQLRRGGEFLTHVWLLMAHLGITEQS